MPPDLQDIHDPLPVLSAQEGFVMPRPHVCLQARSYSIAWRLTLLLQLYNLCFTRKQFAGMVGHSFISRFVFLGYAAFLPVQVFYMYLSYFYCSYG